MDVSSLMLVDTPDDEIGHHGDDHSLEDKDAEDVDETAGNEHPSVDITIDIEVVQGVGVDEQIQGQQPPLQSMFVAERLPVAAGE